MPFPFSIRYKKQLNSIIDDSNIDQALKYVKKRIIEKSANNVITEDSKVSYKGTTAHPTRSLFARIDNGAFTFTSLNDKSYLCYKLDMYRFCLTLAIMALIAAALVRWWFGIMTLLWGGGLNWTINYVQHKNLLNSLVLGIDELYYANSLEKRENKEKLKSRL